MRLGHGAPVRLGAMDSVGSMCGEWGPEITQGTTSYIKSVVQTQDMAVCAR